MNLQPKHFKVVLWDVDGTLLNFYPAERYAISSTMEHYGLPACTDEMIACYSKINEMHWKRMELGQITKQQVLEGRFEMFFKEMGFNCTDYKGFNDLYQKQLGAKVFLYDDAYEIMENLQGKVKQYAVTNGTSVAQALKLKNSGLGEFFDGVFISDQIGYEKPSKEFFDFVEAHIEPVSKDEIILIGDSLTSDMKGANVMGCKACWFNVYHKPEPTDGNPKLDYIIDKLIDIEKFL